jgi:hypothetical protein
VFLHDRNFQTFLGDIQRNSTGHIIGAKATYIHWFSQANVSASNSLDDNQRKSYELDVNVN